MTNAPFEPIGNDFLHLEKSSGGYEYILVIAGHFTWYTLPYATRDCGKQTLQRLHFTLLFSHQDIP